ncbi:hypothetical protein QE152_g11393 [Popillia japonica]|uniref:Uncharacterized protein n=1 Tax=Popillia japonica TaxID=7064 RepID=A0AAW1LTF8_POPJA
MKGLSDTVATEISYSNAASRNLQQKTVPEQKAYTVATEISYSNAASRNLQQKTVPEQKASKITKILKEDIQHGSKPVGHVENTAEGWKTVSRQRKRVPVIFGSSNEDTAIKAAVKYSHYHVYRLQPNIKCEQLEMHLKNKNIDNVKCTKITSKHPDEYSSFKVIVPPRYENIIQDPATWLHPQCRLKYNPRPSDMATPSMPPPSLSKKQLLFKFDL